MADRPRAHVYIDGYNLYYGSLKGTPYKWLNIRRLAEVLLPDHHVVWVRYFTARVNGTDHDPDQPTRQDAYLRALKTLSGISIKEGFYQEHVAERRYVDPPDQFTPTAWVWDPEEKGSDVNLATSLLLDAFDRSAGTAAYDLAVVVSNDADLVWPIDKVRQRFGLKVGVYKPERPARYPNPPRQDSGHLKRMAAWYERIEEQHLIDAQFPDDVPDPNRLGSFIRKPKKWD